MACVMGFADWKRYINNKFGNGNLRCYYRISISSLPILWYFHCQNISICGTAHAYV